MIVEGELRRGHRVGEYVVDALLGWGGFGTVYSGVQPVIGKPVAIKVLHRPDAETTARFVNEARAVNAIRHPNLVDIFAFGELEDGRPYLVMEWLGGEPLDRYLDRVGGRLEPQAILAILEPLGRALDAAHATGIIHRDLKPSNIFLTVDADGQLVPKLLDFGIAKLQDPALAGESHTKSGHAIGTPDYMAPEQCAGQPVDHRADIYAFGVMVFRVLTGEPLFTADTSVELMMKQMTAPPAAASSVRPSLPRSLDAPLLAMLAKEPEGRPESLAAALSGLRAALVDAGYAADEAPPAVKPPAAPTAVAAAEGPEDYQTELPAASGSRSTGMLWVVGAVALALAALPFVLDLGPAEQEPVEQAATPVAVPPSAPEPELPPEPAPEPAAEPAPAAAPPPAPKPTATVSFAGLPDGARILAPDGTLLGTAPTTIELPRSDQAVALRFEKDGFVPATSPVTPTAATTVEVTLQPVPKPKASKPKKRPAKKKKESDKNSVENPY